MDYTKECWFCKKVTMVKKGDYYQCQECGATWNEQPKLVRYQDIAVEEIGSDPGTKYTPVIKGGKIKPPLTPTQKAARAKTRKSGIRL